MAGHIQRNWNCQVSFKKHPAALVALKKISSSLYHWVTICGGLTLAGCQIPRAEEGTRVKVENFKSQTDRTGDPQWTHEKCSNGYCAQKKSTLRVEIWTSLAKECNKSWWKAQILHIWISNTTVISEKMQERPDLRDSISDGYWRFWLVLLCLCVYLKGKHCC